MHIVERAAVLAIGMSRLHAAVAQARGEAAYTLGVQACLRGVPFVEYARTVAGALEAGATGYNFRRKFETLKSASYRLPAVRRVG